MDKNTYETYEYLPTNSSETDQFFVVQDDGTFLLNRQVQYVTQVQNVKEVLGEVQPCTVFDVGSQQFLVDVENSSDIISVSDQMILPEGENNLYTNGYLLQPGSNMPSQKMEVGESVNEYKNLEPLVNSGVDDVTTTSCKQADSPTEITLNDAQYEMLEQKGWILLEKNDKVYLLDTMGLHDITGNDELINKLRSDSQISNLNQLTSERPTILQHEIEILDNNTEILSEQPSNFIIGDDIIIQNENSNNMPLEVNIKDDIDMHQRENIENPEVPVPESKIDISALNKEEPSTENIEDSEARVLVIQNDDIHREGNTLRVKTKLCLKNFPDKIVLGKTRKGKRLVARVKKTKHTDLKLTTQNNINNNLQPVAANERNWEVEKNLAQTHLGNVLNETEFLNLIHRLFKNNINKCSVNDVVGVNSVIAQLLRIHAFKLTVMDGNLVVSKTVQSEDSSGNTITKELSAVVTGKVTSVDGQWHFVHLPFMLENMINDSENIILHYEKGKNPDISKMFFEVLHIQISELKQNTSNIVKVSVTVNKRNIPMTFISNLQKRPTTMYACSACASLFKTEELLKEHQMTEGGDLSSCKLNIEKLKVDKDQVGTDKIILENKGSTAEYKCNMCPSSFPYLSTLSKHILGKHIKIQKDNLEIYNKNFYFNHPFINN